MKRYAKSLKEFEKTFEFDEKKIIAAMKRFKVSPKIPTTIAWYKTTILELKAAAKKQGIPYQDLIRLFIFNGLERIKRQLKDEN